MWEDQAEVEDDLDEVEQDHRKHLFSEKDAKSIWLDWWSTDEVIGLGNLKMQETLGKRSWGAQKKFIPPEWWEGRDWLI